MADDSAPRIPAPGDKPAGLLPLPKVRVYKTKDGHVREKFAQDVSALAVNEVRALMVQIAGAECAEQIRIDNPPAFTNVDGVRGKDILQVRRRLTVSFGVRLKVAALDDLKRALVAAINASTTRRSGRLSDPNNWQFHYVRNGQRARLPLGGASGIPMGPRDVIFLMPARVPYASAQNMRVAGSHRLSFRRSEKQKRIRKADQSLGFVALAARAANTLPAFAGFHVTSGHTARYAVPGEVRHRFGVLSPFIKITPATGRGRRR